VIDVVPIEVTRFVRFPNTPFPQTEVDVRDTSARMRTIKYFFLVVFVVVVVVVALLRRCFGSFFALQKRFASKKRLGFLVGPERFFSRFSRDFILRDFRFTFRHFYKNFQPRAHIAEAAAAAATTTTPPPAAAAEARE
jgi:hypothetical protein